MQQGGGRDKAGEDSVRTPTTREHLLNGYDIGLK